MPTRLRAADLLWPTLFALPALAVLIGLGTWQMQRKSWKDGLVAQIAERTARAPVALDTATQRTSATLGPEEEKKRAAEWARLEYTPVTASGQFAHLQEQHLYAPDPRLGPGYHVYTPLLLDDPHCKSVVIVNRGFVPEAMKASPSRSAARGRVEAVGLVRFAEQPGPFTPVNDTARNIWYWRDLYGMATAMGLDKGVCVVPFFIDALTEPANPGGWPRGGTTNLNIPNRHLEYAITWFGLAATLVGVFVAFAAGRLRDTGKR